MATLKNTPTSPSKAYSKKKCKKALATLQDKLFDLQNLFYADGRYALLIILQGLDTSGKDGTVRHVMSCMNPMGVDVKSFKQPTEEELQHDFLWRIYPHLPAKGIIEVFNRSYYEDIIVPSIDKSIPKKEILRRSQLLDTLEDHFHSSNIHVLKFFLHVSKEEQLCRIKERLILPHKRWKYDKADVDVAEKWDDYTKVYDKMISDSNTTPWHIIPADKRWYRNYAVAKIVTEHLESLSLKYPNT